MGETPLVRKESALPSIVAYATVVQSLAGQQFKSLYYNSGAFGFARETSTVSRGWIGKPDASIRDAALPLVRQVAEPYEKELAKLFTQAWTRFLPGVLWMMPKSHWAFELKFGSRDWMPAALAALAVDWKPLQGLNTAPALEFVPDEADRLSTFVSQLLSRLKQSDFQCVFPGRRTICTIHSRGQLWWTTTETSIATALDLLLPGPADASR